MAHSWFRSVMRRNRFLEILRYLHVADNSAAPASTDPGYNKLWKIQPIISKLSETCAEMYKPNRQLSIDESMIGTKCHLSFIQYMKAKPVKWGVKVWVCADGVTGCMHIQHLYWEGQKQNHLIQRVLLTKLLLHSQKLSQPSLHIVH